MSSVMRTRYVFSTMGTMEYMVVLLPLAPPPDLPLALVLLVLVRLPLPLELLLRSAEPRVRLPASPGMCVRPRGMWSPSQEVEQRGGDARRGELPEAEDARRGEQRCRPI